ncbi:putative ubiquitin conjugating enzyme [Aspergillus undulatus]|uniref:putative ubiquitin conjugating enzyme n=1 Tax=Aspergillus undulatus TaxID=1810928 RepID=UPI003CCDE927
MPRRDFQRDLAEVCLPDAFPQLSDIRAGSEDGSFYFTYRPLFDASPIDVEVTIPDTSEYPREHHYFVFTVSEHVPEAVPGILEDSLDVFHGLPLKEFLGTVTDCLDKATSTDDGSLSDFPQQDSGSDQPSDMDWDENSDAGINPPDITINIRECIRADLRKARAAGFRVGLLGEPESSVILSASRRIARLGISNEAMEAWGVRPSDYLVLLIRYPYGYRRLPDVVGNTIGSGSIQLYAGVCEKYKPSWRSAHHAFVAGATPDSIGVELAAGKDNMEPVLNSIFIGKSLQALLNTRFTDLLRYRLENGFSWTGAELYLNDGQGRLLDAVERSDPKYYEPERWRVPPPDFLRDDHLANIPKPEDMSLLLIAMQFTLRRFVKCTEFCLNCYCKIDAGFEALKPFVCSKGLCLYQYMALGMGPSLEWEISSQPYVVDLLISFAYTRIASGKLEDFPTGFPLKVPHPERRAAESTNTNSTVYRGHLTFDQKLGYCLRMEDTHGINEGDWIVILLESGSSVDQAQISNRNELHARVKVTSDRPNLVLSDLVSAGHLLHETQSQGAPYTGHVQFVTYDTDFASLEEAKKPAVLLGLLNTLPSVSQMKAYIDQKHGGHLRQLSQWKERIHLSALYALQWIVGSNRSVIMYDDDPQHQVTGMTSYVQFRFAQGAPDKEQRFVKSVNQTAHKLGLKHPTLFAWHGTSLHNWHSILREGLHFKDVVHGRSFGNGIYMSQDFGVSLGYCRNYMHRDYSTSLLQWPGSELKCTMAISLNEVVNAPGEFVSQTPHYVVQKLDWVQPRYLFIECGRSIKDQMKRPKAQQLSHVYSQDPQRIVRGPHGPLTIPISATNSHRSREGLETPQSSPQKVKSAVQKGKRKMSSVFQNDIPDDNDDVASMETLPEDRLILLSDDDNDNANANGKPSENNISGIDRTTLTSFKPNTLDASTLQLLGEPTYATSRATRTLQKILRQALDTQTKQPLHELGWYINAHLIDNVYQWIVELHSFDKSLQLARDLEKAKLSSIVMEMRFPSEYPLSPPFLRIIRPRFVRFTEGGGGHITAGGSMCMELLTTNGWMPTFSIESVLLQVRMAITNEVPRPAKLDLGGRFGLGTCASVKDYGIGEAISEYKRICIAHGWTVPKDFDQIHW